MNTTADGLFFARAIIRFSFCAALAALILTGGCASPRPEPDPLVGWTFRPFDKFAPPRDQQHYHLEQAITDDYQNFIAKNKLYLMSPITGFFEDGTGQHAVSFEALDDHVSWHYAIIYSSQNKRFKVIKYNRHRYRC